MELNFIKNRRKMRKSLFEFKILKIDFSFFIMFFVAIFIGEIKMYLIMTIFILLHESAHFFVAKKMGYYPEKIHLNFFGAALEGVDDFNLSDEIKVVLAGPSLNLFFIILCYLSFWFYPESFNFLNEILIANWSIFLFNFLPIFPLDLGRLILVVFSKNHNRKQALKITKNISIFFVSLLFVVFVVSFFFKYNFSLGFVCVNLMFLVLSSSKNTSYKRLVFVSRKYKLIKKGLLSRTIYIDKDVSYVSLFKFIDDYHFVNFVFLDENMNVCGELDEVEFYKKVGLAGNII